MSFFHVRGPDFSGSIPPVGPLDRASSDRIFLESFCRIVDASNPFLGFVFLHRVTDHVKIFN